KASRLVVVSEDPGAYDGVDPETLSRNARALSPALNPMRQASQANKISWTLGAASGLEWAKTVFPNATSDDEAVDLLWDQIFKTCRIYDEDPIKAWEEHEAR
ncbi:aminopeptidase, partial [Streptococcus suis]